MIYRLFFVFFLFGSFSVAQNNIKYATAEKFILNFFSSVPEKSEFESYGEYENRIPKWDTSTIVSFPIPANSKYDPDRSVLNVFGGKLLFDEYNQCFHLTIHEKERIKGNYSAQSVGGAKFLVKRVNREISQIRNIYPKKIIVDDTTMITGTSGVFSKYMDGVWIELPMDGKTAKKLHNKIKIILSIKIPSYYIRGISKTKIEPTFFDPFVP